MLHKVVEPGHRHGFCVGHERGYAREVAFGVHLQVLCAVYGQQRAAHAREPLRRVKGYKAVKPCRTCRAVLLYGFHHYLRHAAVLSVGHKRIHVDRLPGGD